MQLNTIYFSEKSTKKGVWTTDLHLDSASPQTVRKFFNCIKKEEPDFLLIGGDIYNGVTSLNLLQQLAEEIGKPLYFVLGNHDFYFGSIARNRELAEGIPDVHYLTSEGLFELSPTTVLIGHDGWADAREGNFLGSTVLLNDYLFIDELKEMSRQARMEVLNKLGTEAAENIRDKLGRALKKYSKVLILTHTPPFVEACLYDHKLSDPNWSPHFVCKAMGDVLLEAAESNPDKQFLVLCGHSHHAADIHPLSNLHVVTGHSEYGSPIIQGIIQI